MIHFVVANENTRYELHVPALGQFYRSLSNGPWIGHVATLSSEPYVGKTMALFS